MRRSRVSVPYPKKLGHWQGEKEGSTMIRVRVTPLPFECWHTDRLYEVAFLAHEQARGAYCFHEKEENQVD